MFGTAKLKESEDRKKKDWFCYDECGEKEKKVLGRRRMSTYISNLDALSLRLGPP